MTQNTHQPSLFQPVLPVSMLLRQAREHLETKFPLCWVSGEISNLTIAASGHAYFSLKDKEAQARCVMFRNRAQLLGWRLENGQHIEARVLVTLYEARGDFQLGVETIRKTGIGRLYEQFLELKDKLEREGLFSPERKRPLPPFPRTVGIITSLQAAALRDVLTTLLRRAPYLSAIIYPAPVQGEGAGKLLAAAIHKANRHGLSETLILCRGGGSLEDLWAFNDETLVRAIHASAIPVISGVGHETDVTLADFAADQRAATPTAAAEQVATAVGVFLENLDNLYRKMERATHRVLDDQHLKLDHLSRRLIHPSKKLLLDREHLMNLGRRLNASAKQMLAKERHQLLLRRERLFRIRPDLDKERHRVDKLLTRLTNARELFFNAKAMQLGHCAASLQQLNPEAVLARGYSIVTDENNKIVYDANSLEPNDLFNVAFHIGKIRAKVVKLDKS